LPIDHNESDNISCDGVVANRGEDLRFPISSSSGFSSPFAFGFEDFASKLGRILQIQSAGFFLFFQFFHFHDTFIYGQKRNTFSL